MRFYGNITKVDAEQRMVWGYASTEAVDSDGEVIKRSAIEAALEDYMKFANIREMHQPSAVGIAKEAFTDEKGLYIAAKVVDDDAWAKVEAGVYKGFSIGGKVLERDPKARKTITKVGLFEISLVDRPANPEAVFDVWKVADIGEDMPEPEITAGDEVVTEPIEKAAEEQAIVEIATESVEKTAEEVVAEEPVDPVAKADALLSAIEASEKPVEEIQKSADEVVLELTAKVADLEKLLGEKTVEKAAADEQIETLTKAASSKEEALTGKEESIAKLADRTSAAIEVLTKRLDTRDAQIDALTKRLEEVALLPAPSKTLGPGAGIAGVVEKGADAAGALADKGAALSDEEVQKALASMSNEDRALALIKATHRFPRQISVR